jgi:hypothetical protein
MDKEDIIAMSPTVRDEGALAQRIVMREFRSQFVVHRECRYEDGKTFCQSGFYYVYGEKWGADSDCRQEALAKAWACFEHRSRRLMHLEETGVS